MRSIGLTAIAVCSIVWAGLLRASTPMPYALSADVSREGPRAVLTLRVDARMALGSVTLALRSSDNLFLGTDQLPMTLNSGDSARVSTTVEWLGGPEPVGYVAARVLSGRTQVGYSVNVFYLSMVKGRLALLDDTQLVAVLEVRRLKEAAADADQRAEALVRQLRARGRRLVPSSAVEVKTTASASSAAGVPVGGSVADAAFDRLVGPDSVEPCVKIFYQSNNNAYYRLRGSPKYRDPVLGDSNALGNAGVAGDNSFTVITQVEFENECGESTVRAMSYSSTSSAGVIDITVPSISPPGTNPVLQFSTTCPDAGDVDYGSFALFTHDLYGASVVGSFSTPDTWWLDSTVFTAQNSYRPFLFLWEATIRSIRSAWHQRSSYFDSVTGNFRAAYDRSLYGSNANNAYFDPNRLTITFGDGAGWASPYLVAHESGHFLQFNLQSGNLSGGGDWSQVSELDPATAFREGFGDFCAAIGGWDGVSPFPVGRAPQYLPPQFCESGECHRLSGTGAGQGWSLNVTGFLWDLFDSTQSGQWDLLSGSQADYLSLPLETLLSWRSSPPFYTDIQSLFSDWASRSMFSPSCSAAHTLATLNGMTLTGCP